MILKILKTGVAKLIAHKGDFYLNLFKKNPSWSKPTPNDDEIQRWKVIESFIKNHAKVDSQMKILDVGCGRGWLSNLLSSFGSVIGIEPEEKVVKYGKTLFPDLDIRAQDLDFFYDSRDSSLGKFDLIVSSEVIEHVPHDKKKDFLKKIFNLLKEGGFFIITTPRKEILDLWQSSYGEPDQPVEEWLTENELQDFLINTGFEIIDFSRIQLFHLEKVKGIEIYQAYIVKKV